MNTKELFEKAIGTVVALLGYRGYYGDATSLTPVVLIRVIRVACFGERMSCWEARQAARKLGLKNDWKAIVKMVGSGEFLARSLVLRDEMVENEAYDIEAAIVHQHAAEFDLAMDIVSAMRAEAVGKTEAVEPMVPA